MVLWLTLSLVLIVLDQLIKYIVIQNVSLQDIIEVVPGLFNLVYVKNTGAAFSILSGKTYILSLVSLAICIFLVYYLVRKKPKNKLCLVSFGMILGGAVGNLIDRVWRNFVVDYIELAFMNFPVFNLADIAITAGAVLLMVYMIFFDSKS